MPMDPERWHRVETIYHAALDRPEAERDPCLREACAASASDFLLREVHEPMSPVRGALEG